MKRIIFFLILVIAVIGIVIYMNPTGNPTEYPTGHATENQQSEAKIFKVENINSKDITYYGKQCYKGDTISDSGFDSIGWSHENDAMELRDIETHKITILRAKESDQYGGIGLWESYITSTRGIEDLEMLAEEMDTIYIFSEWHKIMGPNTDGVSHLVLKYSSGKNTHNINIGGDERNDLSIFRSFFDDVDSDTINCELECIDENNNIQLVSPKVTIILLEGID